MRNGSTWPELSLRVAPQRSTDDADDADDADADADDDGGDDDASGAWADAMQVGTGPLLARPVVTAVQREGNATQQVDSAEQQRALHDARRGATACVARNWACLFLPAAQPLLQSASLSPFVPWMRKAMRLVQAAPDVSTHPPAPCPAVTGPSGIGPSGNGPSGTAPSGTAAKWDCG